MTVIEYKACFHDFSIYFYTNIAIKCEKIQKFINVLDVSPQLATTYMVVYRASF